MSRLWLFAVLLLGSPFAAQAQGDAPFCVYSSRGLQCRYSTADQCRWAAGRDAMCVPNPAGTAGQTQKSMGPMGIYQHIQDEYDRGRREAQERREHEARVQLLEAQAQAVAAGAPGGGQRSPLPRRMSVGLTGETFGELAKNCQRLVDASEGRTLNQSFADDAAAVYCWGFVDGFLQQNAHMGQVSGWCPDAHGTDVDQVIRRMMPAAIEAPALQSMRPAQGLARLLAFLAPCGSR